MDHPVANIGFPIIFSLPMIFYVVYSGIMMQQLKKPGIVCKGFDKNGDEVDALAKYLIMAKLCFSTSLIIAVTNISAGIFSICSKEPGVMTKLCKALNGCAGCAFFANCVVIPVTIFAQYSRPCHKIILPDEVEIDGPLEAQYKGFKIIWIVMLALSFGLILIFLLFLCIMICCLAGRMK